jgi:hypothetical protein
MSMILVFFALLWVACIVATGRLFKASGRHAFAGYLVGSLLTRLGLIIGLAMLAKGPPKPKKPDSGWGVKPPPGGGPFWVAPPRRRPGRMVRET